MGKKGVDKDSRSRRYIRITDDGMWDIIDDIAKEEKYSKSFNKIINDALMLGLPALQRVIKNGEDSPWIAELIEESGTMTDSEYRGIVVRLLKKMDVNILVNKFILSSLFNAKELEYDGKPNIGLLTRGSLSTTPEFISEFEESGLKSAKKV